MTDSKRPQPTRESRPDWRKAMGLDPAFPLFPHQNGRWCRKIKGAFHYFGRVAQDPTGQAALALWLEQKDALLAGRTPQAKGDGLTLRDACNLFLEAKELSMNSGQLSPRTFDTYKRTAEALVAHFGRTRLFDDLTAQDFRRYRAELERTRGPVAMTNELTRIRSVLKFAYEDGHADKPLRLGDALKRPSIKSVRQAREARGPRMLEPAELCRLLNVAGVQMKAMILLGLNCGYGNNDCGKLPLKSIDLEGGWVSFARPKTGIARRCPLWPETVQAIRAALEKRPTPKDEDATDLVFVTKYGGSWAGNNTNQPISKELRKLLDDLGLHRPGLNFYALRHIHRTIADEVKDQPACDSIMGHTDNSMAGRYRERINDERLLAVTNHVRSWLFPKPIKHHKPGNRKPKPAPELRVLAG